MTTDSESQMFNVRCARSAMCIATPGRIEEIYEKGGVKTGRVLFGEETKEICLECVPETKKGDFVITHENLAIRKLSEKEAEEMISVAIACSHSNSAPTDR